MPLSPRNAHLLARALVLLAFFALLALDIHFRGILATLDAPILHLIRTHLPQTLLPTLSAITHLGSANLFVIPLAFLVAILLIVARRWRWTLLWLLALGGSALLTSTLKLVIARPRPWDYAFFPMTPGFSFPSGHTIAATVAFGMLAYFIASACPRLRTPAYATAAALSLATATALVLICVHYPTDVAAALAIALAWLHTILTLDRPKTLTPDP